MALPKVRTIPFESLTPEEKSIEGVLFVRRGPGQRFLVDMPRLSALDGLVRFASVSIGLTLSGLFAAMFIDFFLLDETLSFTGEYSLTFALAATSIAFADLLHKFGLLD